MVKSLAYWALAEKKTSCAQSQTQSISKLSPQDPTAMEGGGGGECSCIKSSFYGMAGCCHAAYMQGLHCVGP